MSRCAVCWRIARYPWFVPVMPNLTVISPNTPILFEPYPENVIVCSEECVKLYYLQHPEVDRASYPEVLSA